MYDLNVPWPGHDYSTKALQMELTNLHNTIAMLYTFGYRYIAINFIVSESVKVPVSSPDKLNPIPINELRKQFGSFKDIHLFSRITVVITDPAKTQNIPKIINSGAFDLIAVLPTTEKALQLATTNLDIDLVSLPMSTKLPFFLKHKTVGLALSKGIKFEICYSGLVSGPAGYESSVQLGTTAHMSRKDFFFNCLQLIRAARCKGLAFSSGATEPLHVRNYTDVIAIMQTLGLKVSNSKEGFTRVPESVLVKGRLRIKSNKQTIMIGNTSVSTSRVSPIIGDEQVKRGLIQDFVKNSANLKRPASGSGPDLKRVKL